MRPAAVVFFILIGLAFAFQPLAKGQTAGKSPPAMTSEGKRIYYTQRLESTPPVIDGKLDDQCWSEGSWSGDYLQFMPEEGAHPSQETHLKILYDDNNIYVAMRAFDTEPEKIDRTLGRRDMFEGDILGVCFDSYFDHRTGFEFDLTAGGAKIDLLLMNDGWDTSWDAVWYGAVGEEPNAWTAEMQIPLSQLRYGNKQVQTWGLHSWRWINRNREEAQWNLIPRDNPGHLYSIGELHGIEGIRKSRNLELLPYAMGRYRSSDRILQGDTKTSKDFDASFGLDGKYGLTSDFTLDFTVNPDFGQVEVDPSVLNITVFETFYEEKRPFFLEGKNIFDFSLDHDLLFYSRRIGQAPSFTPSLAPPNERLILLPESTSIIGALKLTGKTKNGLSIGIIESVTNRERAEIEFSGGTRLETVEPFSNYLVARVQQDFNQGRTFLGGMFSSVNRKIDDQHLEFLSRDAFSGGFDFLHQWKDRTYFVDFKSVLSEVRGSEMAMGHLQRSSVRYFQRPDAEHLEFKPRDHLTGHGGELEIGKGAGGRWRYSGVFSWRSPGLELNDIGYIRVADVMTQGASLAYVVNEPSEFVREYQLEFEQENDWNFGKEHLSSSGRISAQATLANKWGVSGHLSRTPKLLDTRLLRGGPAVRLKGFWSDSISFHTDNSRKLTFNMSYHGHQFDDQESRFYSIEPGIRLKVTQAMLFSTNLEYTFNRDIFQYVTRRETDGQQRDIVGRINQRTTGLSFRLDYAVTPDLTIQYFGNPFVSVGEYTQFKRFLNPRSADDSLQYHTFAGDEILYDPENNLYLIDEQLDGQIDYTFPNPDFNYRELRSNLVLRWEFKPGSTFYVVWTQGRMHYDRLTDSSLRLNFRELFSDPADNVFLVKLSYWLPF